MENDEAGGVTCSNCGNPVNDDDDFCPRCGSIFSDSVFCDKHKRVEAEGVCIVCGVPCCDDCGADIDGIFLCNRHSDYEIYEGMVKVFGNDDEAKVEIVKSRLEEAGLHPELFHLRRSKDRGHAEYEPIETGEDFNSSEIKLMVPCEEVEKAEEVLRNSQDFP